jgi:hypothetical protein
MRVQPPYVRCVRALSWQPGVTIQEIDRSLIRGRRRLFSQAATSRHWAAVFEPGGQRLARPLELVIASESTIYTIDSAIARSGPHFAGFFVSQPRAGRSYARGRSLRERTSEVTW